MSATHFVNVLSDLSIFSRAVPNSLSGEKEWVLKIVTTEPATQKTEVVFEVLSANFTDLQVKHKPSENGYEVTIDNRSSAPLNAERENEITSTNISYSFEENVLKHANAVVVEDITMHFTYIFEGPLINDQVLVINIEETGTADEYRHRFWHDEVGL